MPALATVVRFTRAGVLDTLQKPYVEIGIRSKVVGTPWPTVVEKVAKVETTPDISVFWIST